MPGKARRVASRQAQLSRRRKRQQSSPEIGRADVSESMPNEQDLKQASAEDSAVPESVALDATETPTPRARPTPRPPRPSPVADRTVDAESVPARGGARGRRDRLPAQVNIWPEIRRILAMSSTVLVIIIVLGIVL